MSHAGNTSVPSGIKWAGIALILLVGLIHLLESPDYFEAATYVGALFIANAAGALVAAFGIVRGNAWGWVLGLLISGGAFVAYIISRTSGLPGAEALAQESFFEPSGVLSLVVEAFFVILFLTTGRRSLSTA